MEGTWKNKVWIAISLRTEANGDIEVGADLRHSTLEPESRRWFRFAQGLTSPTFPPRLGAAAEELLALIGEAHVIAAHDWPRVDAFMRDAVGEQWTKTIEGRVIIDTLVLVRSIRFGARWCGRDPYGLAAMARRCRWRTRVESRELIACEYTHRIVERCAAWLPDDGGEVTAWVPWARDAHERRDAYARACAQRVANRPRSPAGRWLPMAAAAAQDRVA